MGDRQEDDDEDIFEPGEVVCSLPTDEGQSSWSCYRIEDQVGQGRCCQVYSAHSCVIPDERVAIKCYKRGGEYVGALSRELHILDMVGKAGRGRENIGSFIFA